MSTATIEKAVAPSGRRYSQLVERIRAGETGAMEELYRTFQPGLRWMIMRSLGAQDADDVVNDTFYAAFKMIQQGAVREPERLVGYLRGIARIQILNNIQSRVVGRERESELDCGGRTPDGQPSPEELAQVSESYAVAREALNGLPERHREVLVRFYLRCQSPEEICGQMSLTPTQFRLIKSRAKDRLGQLGKRILKRKRPGCSLWNTAAGQPALQTSQNVA